MDVINLINDIESNRDQDIDALVPFPDLDEEILSPRQPTDSETTAASSSSRDCDSSRFTAASTAMDSSSSSASRSTDVQRPAAAGGRRISYQDEMHSIDIEAVPDPAVCIRRILDGLVAELKEEAAKMADEEPGNKVGASDQDDAKRTRLNGDLDVKPEAASEKANADHDKKVQEQEESSQKQDDTSKCSSRSNSSKSNISKRLPIQTILTWMDTFPDSELIQLSCLQSLPSLLEHNPLRYDAQTAGLATTVFYNMTAFPKNFLLQLTAFHTLVVLLRPLGVMEGSLVKGGVDKGISTSKVCGEMHMKRVGKEKENANSDGLDKPNSLLVWEENGVRVMLDTLRSYSHDRYIQAMGCWAMVNAALYPSLKKSLLKLGGVYVVTNAMMLHPNAEAVQFRGLFALINFVIPACFPPDVDKETTPIHRHVYQIARLTILAMKNFHNNKSILNRGCLVLRNLSLTPSHTTILARTPGCVDMLLHARQVCPRDALVQRSARTIMILIHRITEKEVMDGIGDASIAERGAASDPTSPAKQEIGKAASECLAERNTIGTPASPTKQELGKRTRNSCSY